MMASKKKLDFKVLRVGRLKRGYIIGLIIGS
jgi:hypothetical protein